MVSEPLSRRRRIHRRKDFALAARKRVSFFAAVKGIITRVA